jgi:hypothetical protein
MVRCPYCRASYSTALEVAWHSGNSGCRRRFEERQLAIRAVVAAQWAVACTLFSCWNDRLDVTGSGDDFGRGWDEGYAVCIEARVEDVSALPTAVEIVDGREYPRDANGHVIDGADA